jgi:hypothetical protein
MCGRKGERQDSDDETTRSHNHTPLSRERGRGPSLNQQLRFTWMIRMVKCDVLNNSLSSQKNRRSVTDRLPVGFPGMRRDIFRNVCLRPSGNGSVIASAKSNVRFDALSRAARATMALRPGG